MSQWTLFSNHGHVLVVLSRDPDARLRDVAQVVGITERAVQKIVRDLQDGDMISIEKQGRRNRYRLHGEVPLRHPLESHCASGDLLALINDGVATNVEGDAVAPVSVARPSVPEVAREAAQEVHPEVTPDAMSSGSEETPSPVEFSEIDPSGRLGDELGREAEDGVEAAADGLAINGDGLTADALSSDPPANDSRVGVVPGPLPEPEPEPEPEPAREPGDAILKPKRKKKARSDDPESIDPGDQGSLF